MSTTTAVEVSERQRFILERWIRNKADVSHRLVERARIILMSADGLGNVAQGRVLGVNYQRVRRWRNRWGENEERLAEVERAGASDKDLTDQLVGLLADEQRPGTPPTFTAEQLAQIISVACERPEDCGRPVTHWTPRELTDEVVKRGIVESISPRHVDRVLKGGISARTKANIG